MLVTELRDVGAKIKHVSVGDLFYMCIDTNDRLFTWGETTNASGELGKSEFTSARPSFVSFQAEEKIKEHAEVRKKEKGRRRRARVISPRTSMLLEGNSNGNSNHDNSGSDSDNDSVSSSSSSGSSSSGSSSSSDDEFNTVLPDQMTPTEQLLHDFKQSKALSKVASAQAHGNTMIVLYRCTTKEVAPLKKTKTAEELEYKEKTLNDDQDAFTFWLHSVLDDSATTAREDFGRALKMDEVYVEQEEVIKTKKELEEEEEQKMGELLRDKSKDPVVQNTREGANGAVGGAVVEEEEEGSTNQSRKAVEHILTSYDIKLNKARAKEFALRVVADDARRRQHRQEQRRGKEVKSGGKGGGKNQNHSEEEQQNDRRTCRRKKKTRKMSLWDKIKQREARERKEKLALEIKREKEWVEEQFNGKGGGKEDPCATTVTTLNNPRSPPLTCAQQRLYAGKKKNTHNRHLPASTAFTIDTSTRGTVFHRSVTRLGDMGYEHGTQRNARERRTNYTPLVASRKKYVQHRNHRRKNQTIIDNLHRRQQRERKRGEKDFEPTRPKSTRPSSAVYSKRSNVPSTTRPASASSIGRRYRPSRSAKDRSQKGCASMKMDWEERKRLDQENAGQRRREQAALIHNNGGKRVWLEGWEEEEDTEEKKLEKEKEEEVVVEGNRAAYDNQVENPEKKEEEEEMNEDDMYQFFNAVRKEELALSKGFNYSRKALGGNKKLYEQMAAQNELHSAGVGEEDEEKKKNGGVGGVCFDSTPRFDYMDKDDRRKMPGPARYDTLNELGSQAKNIWFGKKQPNQMALSNWARRKQYY